jgi:RimJ/RimL family protein N-acetyltransferase
VADDHSSSQPVLTGNGIGLRAISEEDLPVLLEWRNRPHFRKHFREFRELGMAEQRLWFERSVVADPSVLMFSIVSPPDDELVGCCGLVYIDWVNRTADLSIYIGAGDAYIDDELAPDAARTLIRYAFGELDLYRIWTEIYDFDDKKKAFLDGLGFTLEGRHREHHVDNGVRCDSLFYGLLRPEFDAASQDRDNPAVSRDPEVEHGA